MNNTKIVTDIVSALRQIVGPGKVPLHEPSFEGNEERYLKECIDSTYVSSVGKFVDRFELELANFTGAKYAISVVNGTAALQIALKLSGVKAEDEVLIPALTFIATANAVTYCNAVPHFVDSEESTLGIDALKLREYLRQISFQRSSQCVNKITGRVIRAIVPMHTFGHPANIEGLLNVAREFNLVVVEDAAESLGSFYGDQHTGTFGLLGTLSFNGNKILTTGGGGAILTNDESLARRARHLTTTAKLPHAWEFRHDEIGYNYRMPNLNAALGCAQLEQLPMKLNAKRRLFLSYQKVFSNIQGVTIFEEPNNCHSNYWLQTLVLDKDMIHSRNSILTATNEAGIMTRPSWEPLNTLKPYESAPSMDLSFVKANFQSLINVPSSPGIL